MHLRFCLADRQPADGIAWQIEFGHEHGAMFAQLLEDATLNDAEQRLVSTAVRVTGDALDGPDETVRLKVTYKKGKGTRTKERTVKAKYVEREIKDIDRILTFEEIERLVRIFLGFGVVKLRITGGEPLLRRDLSEIVRMIATLEGVDIALTTNGALLAKRAGDLAEAGLGRVTVSLDSIEETVFESMNHVDFPLARVLELAALPDPDPDQCYGRSGPPESS